MRGDVKLVNGCEWHLGRRVFVHANRNLFGGFLNLRVQCLRCRHFVLVILFDDLVVDFLADGIVVGDQRVICGLDFDGLKVALGHVFGLRHLGRIDDYRHVVVIIFFRQHFAFENRRLVDFQRRNNVGSRRIVYAARHLFRQFDIESRRCGKSEVLCNVNIRTFGQAGADDQICIQSQVFFGRRVIGNIGIGNRFDFYRIRPAALRHFRRRAYRGRTEPVAESTTEQEESRDQCEACAAQPQEPSGRCCRRSRRPNTGNWHIRRGRHRFWGLEL